jgi:C4-dicarboxylate transporter DctM subunit
LPALRGHHDPSVQANIQFIVRSAFGSINSTVVLAIPLFMLSGAIMTHGAWQSVYLIYSQYSWKNAWRLPSAVIITVCFMARFPVRRSYQRRHRGYVSPYPCRTGYDKVSCGAIICSSRWPGDHHTAVVPMVLYALVTSVSVSDLFIAAYFGLFIALLMISIRSFVSREKKTSED